LWREIGIVIVDESTAEEVGATVLGPDDAWFRILGVVSECLVYNKNNVVVVEAVVLET
jgi:hypothetical protein